MGIIKKGIKYVGYFIASILLYAFFAALISFIPVSKKKAYKNETKTIYLHSNGVHLSVVLPFKDVSSAIKKGMVFKEVPKYVKFGWGDENFYLNVPTWSDLKFKYAVGAFFLDNPTVMNVTNTFRKRNNWIVVRIHEEELEKINNYIIQSFEIDSKGNKILVPQKLYGKNSFFYKAKGSYSPIKTCNTWVNDCFKYSGLKASYWTIFDFGLLNKYNE